MCTVTKHTKNPKICFQFSQRMKEYCPKYTNTQDVRSNFCISHLAIQLQIKTEDCFLLLLRSPVTYHHRFWPELNMFGMVTGIISSRVVQTFYATYYLKIIFEIMNIFTASQRWHTGTSSSCISCFS